MSQKESIIRLIASDLDDTLLNSRKEITARTARAIQSACKAGIEFVPASGRSIRGLPAFLTETCHYAILMNGGMIVRIHPRKILFQSSFRKEETLQIYDKLNSHFHRPISVFIDGEAYMQADQKKDVLRYETPGMAEFILKNRLSVTDMRQKILSSDNGAGKIGILHYPDERDSQEIKEMISSVTPCAVRDAGDSFDINPNGIDKGSGLQNLAKLLNIPIEETMAFGDAGNDVPMLKAAGIGVCVSNGTQEAKKAADVITDSNNADGVAKAIEGMLNGSDVIAYYK